MATKRAADTDIEGETSPKRARRSSPERSQSSINSQENRRVRGEEDEEDGLEFESASESDAEAHPRVVRGAHMDDAEFERRNLDRVKAAIERKSANKGAAKMGVITHLELHNFMCHKYLTFRFGPQVNFIIGNNGSGKSAVLSAITLALGGKAGSTGRGSGLKSFIKSGETTAEVSIVLKNGGHEPYKTHTYGDSITITRRLQENGGSYKIRNADGKTVSSAKGELDAITDHFGIDVDNPMNILTQDAARQFLSAANSSEKYRLFLRGTQLKQLQEEYDAIRENLTTTERVWAQKQNVIPDLEDVWKVALVRLNEAQALRNQHTKVQELKWELAWAYIHEKEDELAEKMGKIEVAERGGPTLDENIRQAEEKYQNANARIAKIELEVQGLGNVGDLEKEKADLSAQVREGRNELAETQSDCKQLGMDVKHKKHEVEEFERQLAVEQDKLGRDAKREEVQGQLGRAIQDKEAKIREHKRAVADLGDHKKAETAAQTKLQSLQEPMRRNRDKLQGIDAQIDQLKQIAEKGGLAIYHRNMPRLVQQVQGANWYGEKPVGPLGQYVKLKDPVWAFALRAMIGWTMHAWAVTTERDRTQLQRMFKENGIQAQIIVSRVDMFDFSQGEAPQQCTTVLRVLEISHPWVVRLLVNNHSIERTLLALNRQEAEHVLDQTPQYNVWSAEGFVVRRYADGGRSSAPMTIPREGDSRQQLFATNDASERLATANTEKETLAREYYILNQQHKDVTAEFEAAKRSVRSAKDLEKRLLAEAQAAHQAVTRLDAELQEEQPLNIATFQENVDEGRRELQSLHDQLNDAQARHLRLKGQAGPLVKKLDSVRRNIETYEAQKNQLQLKSKEAVKARLKADGEKNHWEGKRRKLEDETRQLRTECQELEAQYQTWLARARDYCNKIETKRRPETIRKEIEGMERALQAREAEQGQTLEELTDECARTKAAVEKAKADFKEMRKLLRLLRSAWKLRTERWQEFRRHIALRCKLQFSYYLSIRGFFGQVVFDHQNEKLELKVQTDDLVGKHGREKDAKMSGGEKSYATICLLLSLWQAIGSPIRALDEFDVFMDSINRRISMKMMLDAAKSSDRQFILITPQDMANVQLGPEVRVHKMNDVERGQQALQF